MKTSKLGVSSTHILRNGAQKSQTSPSFLGFALLSKVSAAISSAVLTLIIPSIVGFSTAFASTPTTSEAGSKAIGETTSEITSETASNTTTESSSFTSLLENNLIENYFVDSNQLNNSTETRNNLVNNLVNNLASNLVVGEGQNSTATQLVTGTGGNTTAQFQAPLAVEESVPVVAQATPGNEQTVPVPVPQPGEQQPQPTPPVIDQTAPPPAEQNVPINVPQPPTQSPNQPPSLPPSQTSPSNEQRVPETPAQEAPIQKKLRIEFGPVGDSKVQADGRSTIKLTGQIFDKDGQLITNDVIVTLTTTAGKFVGADFDKDATGFQLKAINGEFTVVLQSDIKAQRVRVRAAIDSIRKKSPTAQRRNPSNDEGPFPQQTDTSIFNEYGNAPLEAFTQLEFLTNLRPSLATGIVNLRIGPRGTDYWGSFRDFLNPDLDSGTEFDLDASVFATGKIGDWLFTGAFNSDRPLNQDCEGRNRLFGGVQFCEQQYPVYGDSSTATSTAPSIDSFYLRLERSALIPGSDPDYLMWGDYNTEEFSRPSQLYTATTRQLHGFKGNYNFGPLQITGLYSNSIEGFQRDTLVPNGTSGNYFLSRRRLIPGSETVALESEEFQRPGTVVKREPLIRDRDYEIDYDRGTIFFRRPINATELTPFGGASSLQRKIVVTYQQDGGNDSTLLGGRLQFNLSQEYNSRSYIGGSYSREDQGNRDFQLYGADFLLSLGENAQVVGEYARSSGGFDNVSGNRSFDGSAYRIEAFANAGDAFQARGYYRSVDDNFLNNATFSFFPGQTRYGGSLSAKVTDSTRFNVSYDQERNFGTAPSTRVQFFDLFNPEPIAAPGGRVDNELSTFRAGILQDLGFAELGLEYLNRSRTDRVENRFSGDAQQLVSRLKVPFGEKLTFQAQNELNLSGADPLYPNRTTLGLDWRAFPGVTFRLAHQFFDKTSLLRGNSFTTLDTLLEQKLSEDTAVTGRYSVLSGFNGLQGQGAVGLDHRWAIAPGLRINLGLEHVFKNVFNATGTGAVFEQPYAVGQSASSLGLFSGTVYSAGLEYTDNPNFQASGRVEFRDGDRNDTTVISGALAGKLSPSLTALARYQQAGEANLGVNSVLNGVRLDRPDLNDTRNLKLGLAYRNPNDDKFNALFKYEYRENAGLIPDEVRFGDTLSDNSHLLSAEAIYAPNWRWEFYGKYAFRQAITDGIPVTGGNTVTTDTNVNLAQLRTTYRLGYRTDLAVEGRWIGQSSNRSSNFDEFGLAVEGGYYLTPDLRMAVGYAFGSVDDRDFTGYRSESGFYLNISLKLNELLGGFGLQKPVPKQQRESEIKQEQNSADQQSQLMQRLQQQRQEEIRRQQEEFERQRKLQEEEQLQQQQQPIEVPQPIEQPSPAPTRKKPRTVPQLGMIDSDEFFARVIAKVNQQEIAQQQKEAPKAQLIQRLKQEASFRGEE
jgi:uncharacterized protein YegP (UPF0339 family)